MTNLGIQKIFENIVKLKTEISLVLLLFFLFIFERKVAIEAMETLFTFLVGVVFAKTILDIIIREKGNRPIEEYILTVIFSFFIFILIKFFIARLYLHALVSFIFLLLFTAYVIKVLQSKKQNIIYEKQDP